MFCQVTLHDTNAEKTVFSGEISLLSSGPLPEIKSDEHKLQYAKERERVLRSKNLLLDLEVQAVNVGKRLEVKVTAMKSEFHFTSDILEEMHFIKSFK